ncbi:MAG TPA: hypothetical protein VJS64_16090, partial [Pyrinomonadaceae bacterium]|nr:hypothetical protein [Pyrinomonadaceae bacterium]
MSKFKVLLAPAFALASCLALAGAVITPVSAAPIIAAGVSAQAPPGAIFENWETCFVGVGAPCVSPTGVSVNNFGGSMFNIGAIPGVSAQPVLWNGQGAP